MLAEVSECVVVELLSIVKDKDSRNSEVTNDVLPYKALDVLFSDRGQGFLFDPLSKVVDSYGEELELPYRHKEGFYNVKSSLGKGPWGIHWSMLFQQLSCNFAKGLALITCLYVGLGVFLHGGPIVSRVYEIVNQRSCS